MTLSPQDLFYFFKFTTEHQILDKFPIFFNFLPHYVADNISYFNFEEMCLLYYHFMKNKLIFAPDKVDITNGRLNVLKEYIKIHWNSLGLLRTRKLVPG